MSLSVQRSVVESFKFNAKHMRSVYVKGVGQCLVSKNVYEAIGYEKENGVKAIQRLLLEKYKIRFGNEQTELLKEPGLYCFLLRCKKPKAEPFIEWVLGTVLLREVRKLV